MSKTFEQWLADVNASLIKMIGLGTDDLGDAAYYDMYEDDVTPKQAARRVLAQEGW